MRECGEFEHAWSGTLGRCARCDKPLPPLPPEDPLFTRQFEVSGVDPDPEDDPEDPPDQRDTQAWDIYPEMFPKLGE